MRTALIYLISILVMILCVPMSISLLYAMVDQGGWSSSSDQLAFLGTIFFGLSLAYPSYRRSKLAGVHTDIKPTDAFLIVSLTWLIAAAFGALPYFFYGWCEYFGLDGGRLTHSHTLGQEFTSFSNAFFESTRIH